MRYEKLKADGPPMNKRNFDNECKSELTGYLRNNELELKRSRQSVLKITPRALICTRFAYTNVSRSYSQTGRRAMIASWLGKLIVRNTLGTNRHSREIDLEEKKYKLRILI